MFHITIINILEWQEGRAGKLTLNDIDNTSERNNGMVCLNTLKHYMVKDNSRMVLMYKQRDSHTVNGKYVNTFKVSKHYIK